MQTNRTTMILAALLLLGTPAWGEGRPKIEFDNGGFEEPTQAVRGMRCERTTDRPYAGKYAYRIYIEQDVAWVRQERPTWRRGVFSRTLDVSTLVGERLGFDFQARLSADEGWIWPQIVFYDASGKPIGGPKIEKTVAVVASNTWQKIAMDFVVPRGAKTMSTLVWGFGPVGSFYDLDELHLFVLNPSPMVVAYDQPPLHPVPKQAAWRAEAFDLSAVRKVIYFPSPGGYEKETAEKIVRYVGKHAASLAGIEEGTGATSHSHVLVVGSLKSAEFVRFLSQKTDLLAALKGIGTAGEGFVLELDSGGMAVLAGQDGRGAYYAFRAFLQLVRFDPRKIPQGRVIDWPDHPRRIFLDLGMHRNWVASDQAVERDIFEILAGNRFNELTLWCSHWVFDFEDGANTKLNYPGMALSKEKLQRIIRYANENFITVIPGIDTPGYGEWLVRAYPELQEKSAKAWSVCVKNPKFHEVLFPAMREIHETFGRQTAFHIGYDEIRFQMEHLNDCPFCGDTPKWQIVRDDIIKQASFLKSLGVTDVRIWTDMLHEKWNGGPPLLIARARDELPRDLVMQHWLGENGVLFSDEPFFQAGFKKIIWCPTEEVTAPILPNDVSRYHAIGMNKCGGEPMWNVWGWRQRDERSYRNFEVAFRVGNLLWNASHKSAQTPDAEFPYRWGTAIMRWTSDRGVSSADKFTPLALSNRVNVSVAWQLPGDGFDFAGTNEWIASSRYRALGGDGHAIRLTDQTSTVDIPVNRTCRALVVLHTLHLPSESRGALLKHCRATPKHSFEGIPVGRYVIRYSDGSSAEKTVGIGYNIFFDRHPHSRASLLLWDASEVWAVPRSDPLLASVLVVENPHPEKRVDCLRVEKTVAGPELAVFAAAAMN
jgi:hypothetical protein